MIAHPQPQETYSGPGVGAGAGESGGERGLVLPHFKLQVLDSRRKAKDFFVYKNIAKGLVALLHQT